MTKPIYVPLSSQYYLDDRIDAAGEAAELLYVRGLAFCAGAYGDGHLSRSQITRGAAVGLSKVNERIRALTESGLWIPDDDGAGFVIRSWLKWNRPRAEIFAARERDAARKREERRGSPGVSRQDRPRGVQPESEWSPNGFHPDKLNVEDVRLESKRSPENVQPPTTTTTTDGPFGHFVSKTDRTRDVGAHAGTHAGARETPGAAAPERPRPVPPPPEAAAEIAAVLARRRAKP